MKIKIEIPVYFDDPISANERRIFRDYMQHAATATVREFANQKFKRGPHMLDATCRYAFGEPIVKVE